MPVPGTRLGTGEAQAPAQRTVGRGCRGEHQKHGKHLPRAQSMGKTRMKWFFCFPGDFLNIIVTWSRLHVFGMTMVILSGADARVTRLCAFLLSLCCTTKHG